MTCRYELLICESLTAVSQGHVPCGATWGNARLFLELTQYCRLTMLRVSYQPSRAKAARHQHKVLLLDRSIRHASDGGPELTEGVQSFMCML